MHPPKRSYIITSLEQIANLVAFVIIVGLLYWLYLSLLATECNREVNCIQSIVQVMVDDLRMAAATKLT